MSLARRVSLVIVVLIGGCGNDRETTGGSGPDAGGDAGLPPGADCVVDMDAGQLVSTSCQDNPALPTCFQCVDLVGASEVEGVCAYTCRIGEDDCPEGQTCTVHDNAQRTSYQECRDLTGGYEIGYCRQD
jgi:hypothetical protein